MVDYTWEMIALGVDAVICGVSYLIYRNCRNTVEDLKMAVPLDLNSGSTSYLVASTPASSIPYVVVKGTAKALEEPIKSINTNVTGVIQEIRTLEHVATHFSSGFWLDKERVIQSTFHTVPWLIRGRAVSVEITDSMFADVLELQTVADKFETNPNGVVGFLAGWIAGERVKGVQHIENMLVEGSFVTAFGEVASKNGEMYLQQPTNGKPFIITTMSPTGLIKVFENRQYNTKAILFISCGIGLAIGCIAGWKAYRNYQETLRKRREASLRDYIRSERRRDGNLRDDQVCVVCLTNPREVIFLACGHVCTCVDCMEMLNDRKCPVCRVGFSDVARAYIS